MKSETFQKFQYRIELLEGMKSDYLYLVEAEKKIDIDMSVNIERLESNIRLLDILIKSYIRKIERK